MRLRSFVADTMAEVMCEVRDVLGEDAIIVSTMSENDGRVRVTAALDKMEEVDNTAQEVLGDSMETLGMALEFHGVPLEISSQLLGAATRIDVDDPIMRLAAAMDDLFRFSPLSDALPTKPLMLIGPPGMGKTVTAAKLAARATMANKPVSVISIDTSRAAAHDQLAAFTRVLGLELKTADTPKELRFALRTGGPDCPVIIDSDGVNPFDASGMSRLSDFVQTAEVESALVLSAWMNPLEATDIAEALQLVHPTRLITTHIDMARRLGAVLTSAYAGGLSFADASIAPQIANGLASLNPVSLARLLMRDPFRLDLDFRNSEDMA